MEGQQAMGRGCSRVCSWNSEKLSEILTPGGKTPNIVTAVCYTVDMSAVTASERGALPGLFTCLQLSTCVRKSSYRRPDYESQGTDKGKLYKWPALNYLMHNVLLVSAYDDDDLSRWVEQHQLQ